MGWGPVCRYLMQCMTTVNDACFGGNALPKRHVHPLWRQPKRDSEFGKWNWFPAGSGKDFQFGESLKCLDPMQQAHGHRGLSHPNGRKMGAAIWATPS